MSENELTKGRLVAGSVLTMLACGALGGFGGCNIDRLEAISNAGNGYKFISGVLIGLLLGLAFAFYNKSWAHRLPTAWRAFLPRFGYAVACLLVAGLISISMPPLSHWLPASVPIRLDIKNRVSATFTADSSISYDVQISLSRKELDKIPDLSTIRWTVNDVAEGDRHNETGVDYGSEDVYVHLGQFNVIAGHRYTVTAEVTTPFPKTAALDPHLQIERNIPGAPDYADRLVGVMSVMIAVLLGGIVMLWAVTTLVADFRAGKKSQTGDKLTT